MNFCTGELPDDLPEMSEDEDDEYEDDENSPEATMAGTVYIRTVSSYTVAVWTQKPFIPLLTRPQEYQGCQKMRQDQLNFSLEFWCTNIDH